MTNEQLAKMIRLGVTMVDELRKIEGVGVSRIGKYGADLITLSPDMSEGLERRA